MANPQKEDGYTPIANEILEQICKLKLNGTQLKIIIIVWRYTYGFSRKEHELSETFIAKATKTHKIQLSKELKKLIELKIINIVRAATFTSPRIISFNKNYEEWCLNDLQLVNSLTPSNNDNTTASESTNTTASESTNTTASESTNQDKQNIKTNIKQIHIPENKPQKHKYGEYKHVSLTDTEKDKLISEFGQVITDKSITYLDEYIEMKGYKHKSSYLVIKKWIIDAVKEKEIKESKQKGEGATTYGEKYDTGNCYTTEYYDQFKSTGE